MDGVLMIRTHGHTHWTPLTCFGCKVLTVQLSTDPFQPQYNWSVGRYVTTRREFEDALKRCSDANSAIVGIDHDYQPRYPGDTHPIRAADQVLDDHARALSSGHYWAGGPSTDPSACENTHNPPTPIESQ